MPDYIPAQDAEAALWADNFAVVLTADPAGYGETAPVAAAVTAAADDFTAALLAATDPGTRTPVTIVAKDNARNLMEETIRPVAQRINARPSVTDPQRVTIGITVRSTVPTPNPGPTAAIEVLVEPAFQGPTVRISDPATPDTTARPPDARGAQIQTQFAPQTAPAAWVPEADYVQTHPIAPLQVTTPPAVPGTIRIRARWIGGRAPGGLMGAGPWNEWQEIPWPWI